MSQTQNDRHPDIEIYAKQCSIEKITLWLESVFERLDAKGKQGQSYRFIATHQNCSIPITVIDRAIKDYCSIWFDSPQTPWIRDLDCALQAQQQLDTEIRCIVSGWAEGDEPDEWWSVTELGESKIQWQG
ncbi:MAG: hypothetical protein ACJAWL_002678 [Motiliproteus sp.]|jgi:hypothetical protein